jgi:hypothetical protein
MLLAFTYSVIALSAAFSTFGAPELQWPLTVAAAWAALSVWRVSPKALFAVPTLITLVVLNLFVGFYQLDMPPSIPIIFACSFALFHLPFLNPKLLVLFLNPELRWWRRAQRKNLAMPVVLTTQDDIALDLETFDISETGLFVPLSENGKVADDVDLKIGGLFLPTVSCRGRIVRRTHARGRYPAGLGIQFVNLPQDEKAKLKQILGPSPSSSFDSSLGSPQ